MNTEPRELYAFHPVAIWLHQVDNLQVWNTSSKGASCDNYLGRSFQLQISLSFRVSHFLWRGLYCNP